MSAWLIALFSTGFSFSSREIGSIDAENFLFSQPIIILFSKKILSQ